jgi:hypothetical protein
LKNPRGNRSFVVAFCEAFRYTPRMAESPEIPEAKDPFEKRVALTIAILAICLSLTGNHSDNAKTDAIIKTDEASNAWGFFQAKSIKGQMAAMHGDLLGRLAGGDAAEAAKKETARLHGEGERYDQEKSEIKEKAEELEKDAKHLLAVNVRCERAALLLQIAVIICSVAILARAHKFWLAGMALGAVGIAVSITAFLM